MADETRPLSDEERAELEALRAEKAAREERAQAARERAELEALRAEQAHARPAPRPASNRSAADTAEDARIRAQRERGAKLMEPDEDLNMPQGQKIVLGVIALLVVIVLVMTFFTQR